MAGRVRLPVLETTRGKKRLRVGGFSMSTGANPNELRAVVRVVDRRA